MNTWFAERAKAWAGAFAAGVMSSAIKATEISLGIDIGPETEAAITGMAVAGVTYLAVYWTKNRPMP